MVLFFEQTLGNGDDSLISHHHHLSRFGKGDKTQFPSPFLRRAETGNGRSSSSSSAERKTMLHGFTPKVNCKRWAFALHCKGGGRREGVGGGGRRTDKKLVHARAPSIVHANEFFPWEVLFSFSFGLLRLGLHENSAKKSRIKTHSSAASSSLW